MAPHMLYIAFENDFCIKRSKLCFKKYISTKIYAIVYKIY